MSISDKLVPRSDETPKRPAQTKRQTMVFVNAAEDSEKGVPPMVEAFEAMGRFTEELERS